MLRILGGSAKGVSLKVPQSARPSPVRLRKALFDYLRYRFPPQGDPPSRGRFLDLYAGSGAIGLEAASEGFAATLVEKDRQAIALLRENIQKTRLPARLEPISVEQFLLRAAQTGQRFQVAFMAPPYPHDLLLDFERLLEARVVEPGGLLILQHPVELSLPRGERREYGTNAVTMLESAG